MAYELTGKVIEIFDTLQVSDSFRKREFVIEKTGDGSGTEFKDYIKIQLVQDRCSLIDSIQINDEVHVSFNIRGNRWERDGKVSYFTNLDAWRIEKINTDPSVNESQPLSEDDMPPPSDEFNDLPF